MRLLIILWPLVVLPTLAMADTIATHDCSPVLKEVHGRDVNITLNCGRKTVPGVSESDQSPDFVLESGGFVDALHEMRGEDGADFHLCEGTRFSIFNNTSNGVTIMGRV